MQIQHSEKNQNKELFEGINGSGHTTWTVATVNEPGGQWLWMERFDSKAEALNWIKWS